jgi:hypothetical protein
MLTKKQQDLLIGSLLGDAHIEYNGKNCRVRFDHSLSQLEYLKWKHQILLPYVTPINEYKIFDKRTQKNYKKARFNTATNSIFNIYREIFYRDGKKVVPENIKSILQSNLALAAWYLDDGSLKTDCKAFKLHTNNFTFSEVLVLKETLKLNFDLESKPHKQKDSFILYIGSRDLMAKKFSNLVRPLVESEIPSMLYKFF